MHLRDDGLKKAIASAGGVGALAKSLGIAQSSISRWKRVPARRVLAIEAITGVRRTVLRPDLYPQHSPRVVHSDEEHSNAIQWLLRGNLVCRRSNRDTTTGGDRESER